MEQPVQPNQVSHSTSQIRHAGFWVRFYALLFDGLLTSLIIISLTFTLSSINPSWNFTNKGVINILDLVVGFVYVLVFWVKDGATPGKKLFGLKIVKDYNGFDNLQKGLNPSTAIVRWIGYLVSGIILFLGFIWVAFDKNKQGWHDKIAGTFVIRLDNNNRIGLRILVLFLYLLFIIGIFIWAVVGGIRQQGKAGAVVIEKLLSGQEEDLKFSFKKQREAYFTQIPSESRSLVEKSRNLIIEAKTLIARTDCNVQKLNKNIETKLTEAVTIAKNALDLAPNNPYTHYNLAFAYVWSSCYSFGGNDKALLEYQKAVVLDQDFIEARSSLGVIYSNLQNYQAAIPHLEYVTQKVPLCGECWLNLGEVYLRYGAKSRAKEALQTAKLLLKSNNPTLIKVEKLLDELNNK